MFSDRKQIEEVLFIRNQVLFSLHRNFRYVRSRVRQVQTQDAHE